MNSVNSKPHTAGPPVRRTARRAVALALTVFAGLAVGTAPAQAGMVGPNIYRYQNLGSNLCLAHSFGGGLQSLPCTSQTTQHWRDTDPTYRHKNVHTNLCLQDSFGGGLQVLGCTTENMQSWQNISTSGTTWRFKNRHTQKCLTDSLGGGLYTTTCDGSAYQGWR